MDVIDRELEKRKKRLKKWSEKEFVELKLLLKSSSSNNNNNNNIDDNKNSRSEIVANRYLLEGRKLSDYKEIKLISEYGSNHEVVIKNDKRWRGVCSEKNLQERI